MGEAAAVPASAAEGGATEAARGGRVGRGGPGGGERPTADTSPGPLTRREPENGVRAGPGHARRRRWPTRPGPACGSRRAGPRAVGLAVEFRLLNAVAAPKDVALAQSPVEQTVDTEQVN